MDKMDIITIILLKMSLAKISFDGLGWSEFSHILLFLNLNELWLLGKCNRFAFLVFLKEKSFRMSENFKNVINAILRNDLDMLFDPSVFLFF